MSLLPGHIIADMIHEDEGAAIYRGTTADGRTPVLVKILKENKADPGGISDLISECEIMRALETDGVARPVRLEKAGGTFALVMEDEGTISLKEFAAGTDFSIPAFLDIAVRTVEILGEIHQNGVIHMNLKPGNILYGPATGKVKILDFGNAVVYRRKIGGTPYAGILPPVPGSGAAGTPGNAGNADYRTDYHQLGEVFYEILTGSSRKTPADRVPGSTACRPPEMPAVRPQGITGGKRRQTHAGTMLIEAAAEPAPRPDNPERRGSTGAAASRAIDENIGPAVPKAITAIISKMLSENPCDRYQSAYGLLKDLEECRRQWIAFGDIKPFPPGRMDVSPRFELPRRLIGRKPEAEILSAAFGRACGGRSEFILVKGYAGTGKTMLVNEALKPAAMEKGFFAYGKFDQLRQNIPYAPFAHAMGNVMRQLMTESSESLVMWRKKIIRAMGQSGSVIAGLIPEVELIAGRQPPVETLQPLEARNRFNMVFGNFIKIFAEKEHPLVIFLDDLQWADQSSLRLIRHLCRDTGLNHILMVVTCRDNEITDEHPLASTLKEIKEDGINVREISLAQFSLKETEIFISESLNCPAEKIGGLAGIMYRKTCGIPFFLGQLLKTVFNDGLVSFNVKKGMWEWNAEAMEELRMPGDISGLMRGKLMKLPDETRNILALASCIGSVFDIKTLSDVCGLSQDETARLLKSAEAEGLVLKSGCAGKQQTGTIRGACAEMDNKSGTKLGKAAGFCCDALISQPSDQPIDPHADPNLDASAASCEFLHDMVRQTAYSLLPDEEKKKAHVKAGRSILKDIGHEEIDGRIMTVLDHINRGLDLIDDQSERLALAGHNLAAGRKAKASAAFDTALSYFTAGMELLPADSWESCRQLCLDLHLERAQCEYLAGDAALAERLFDEATARIATETEKADVYSIKMVLYAGMGKYADAVQIGINALKGLGVRLPQNPGFMDNARELLLYKWLVHGRSAGDLAGLPEMEDPARKKVAQLLIGLIFATCTSYPDLYGHTIIKAGNYTVKYGNSDIASVGYLGYGIVEGSVLGNYAAGYEMGKLAISLAEKYGLSYSKCVVYFTVGSLISHWACRWEEGIRYLQKAVQYAIEAGNVLITGFAYGVIMENKHIMGASVREIIDEAGKCASYAYRMKHENLAFNAAIYKELALALAGKEDDRDSIWSKSFSAEDGSRSRESGAGFSQANRGAYPAAGGDNPAKGNANRSSGNSVNLFIEDGANPPAAGVAFSASESTRLFDDFSKLGGMDKATQAAWLFSNMQLCYLSGDYRGALRAALEAESRMDAVMGFILSAEIVFYQSLSITAAYYDLQPKDRKRLAGVLRRNRRKLRKWSDACPFNFRHRHLLVEAEKARISGKKQEAGELYDEAVRCAHENACIHLEAIACELAAKFYVSGGREKIAATYLRESLALYRKWGAEGKARQVERRLRALQGEACPGAGNEKAVYDPAEILESFLAYGAASGTNAAWESDIWPLRKLIPLIFGQSDPTRLLKDFLETAVSSSGSNRGFLIFENNDELFVEAAFDKERGHISVDKPIPLEKCGNISRLAVRYAARTLETVVVNGGRQAGIFARDPHISASEEKSIACVPLQLKGIPIGIMYVENSYAAGVYSRERVDFLKLLVGQLTYAGTMRSFFERGARDESGETRFASTESLTDKEIEVLGLIAEGLLNKEIAGRMDTTVNTVKTHIKNIYGKLQVNRRVQAVARAKELNLLR